jgi:hypothetical protein
MTLPMCQLEKVILYHIECPDYIKKFDNPNTAHYLKRQMFHMLLLPYMNTRMVQIYKQKYHTNIPSDISRKDSYAPYPEEVRVEKEPSRDFLNKFIEGAQFTPDEA